MTNLKDLFDADEYEERKVKERKARMADKKRIDKEREKRFAEAERKLDNDIAKHKEKYK